MHGGQGEYDGEDASLAVGRVSAWPFFKRWLKMVLVLVFVLLFKRAQSASLAVYYILVWSFSMLLGCFLGELYDKVCTISKGMG